MNPIFAFKFDPIDNPTQLGKIGHWVITFLDSQDKNASIQLAITSVLPLQHSQELQIRKIIISQSDQAPIWHINSIEYFDHSNNKMISLPLSNEISQNFLKQIIKDFRKYDVEIQLISHE
nr:hypothetical protein [Acinetobacter sp. Marseille-Q1620]